MQGILKTKTQPISFSKKDARITVSDIIFGLQMAKENSRRNYIMQSNVKFSATKLELKNQAQKIHLRRVRFSDEAPVSPDLSSSINASVKKINLFSLSGAEPDHATKTTAGIVEPSICESAHNQLGQQTPGKKPWISTEIDERFPNFVESMISGWKDALASNDLFQSVAPSWLNGSKSL
jgi:hypothetical protein